MTVQNLATQPPFTTKDGSTIRSILDRTNAPVRNQSLAEATVPAGAWHTIAAQKTLHFLCCCAPPYAHEDTFFE